MAAAGAPSATPARFELPPLAAAAGGSAAMWEWRHYQLSLGYASVPALRKEFVRGLPAKVAAFPGGQLAFVTYSDFGCVPLLKAGLCLCPKINLWRPFGMNLAGT